MVAGKKSEAQKIEILERQQKALALRKNGVSYRQVANQLGVSHVQAQRDIKKALELSRRDVAKEAETYRALELERLDDMLFRISDQVRAGHLGAIDRALKIMDRRAKLLGLDAPVKVAPTDPTGEQPYTPHIDDMADLFRLISEHKQSENGKGEGDAALRLP